MKYIPLSMVGNPQHSNVFYKHGGHSLANADISFHMSILGSMAPDTVSHEQEYLSICILITKCY
jgi:hypothetical protein